MFRVIPVLCLFFVFAIIRPVWADDAIDAQYRHLVAHARFMPENFDFTKLRQLYIQTSFYSPVLGMSNLNLSEIYKRLAQNDNTVFAEVASFVNDNAAMAGAQSQAIEFYNKTGYGEQEAYHGWMLDGLINNFLHSGDGLSAKTAFHPVDKIEEYMIARDADHLVTMHATSFVDGHPYDVLTVQSKTGEKKEIWFENSAFYGKGIPGLTKK